MTKYGVSSLIGKLQPSLIATSPSEVYFQSQSISIGLTRIDPFDRSFYRLLTRTFSFFFLFKESIAVSRRRVARIIKRESSSSVLASNSITGCCDVYGAVVLYSSKTLLFSYAMEAITNSYLLQYRRHPHGLTLTRINKIIEPHIVRHLNQTKYCTSALTRYNFPRHFLDVMHAKERIAWPVYTSSTVIA